MSSTKIPLEVSGLPQRPGESTRAYAWRTYGFAEVAGPSPSTPLQLPRLSGETWSAYVARAGEPLEGEALLEGTEGAEVAPDVAAAWWASVEEGRRAVASPDGGASSGIAGLMMCGVGEAPQSAAGSEAE